MELATEKERIRMLNSIANQAQFVYRDSRDICKNFLDVEACDNMDKNWNDMTIIQQAKWIWGKSFRDNETVYGYFWFLITNGVIFDPGAELQLVTPTILVSEIYQQYCQTYLLCTHQKRIQLAHTKIEELYTNFQSIIATLGSQRKIQLMKQFKNIVTNVHVTQNQVSNEKGRMEENSLNSNCKNNKKRKRRKNRNAMKLKKFNINSKTKGEKSMDSRDITDRQSCSNIINKSDIRDSVDTTHTTGVKKDELSELEENETLAANKDIQEDANTSSTSNAINDDKNVKYKKMYDIKSEDIADITRIRDNRNNVEDRRSISSHSKTTTADESDSTSAALSRKIDNLSIALGADDEQKEEKEEKSGQLTNEETSGTRESANLAEQRQITLEERRALEKEKTIYFEHVMAERCQIIELQQALALQQQQNQLLQQQLARMPTVPTGAPKTPKLPTLLPTSHVQAIPSSTNPTTKLNPTATPFISTETHNNDKINNLSKQLDKSLAEAATQFGLASIYPTSQFATTTPTRKEAIKNQNFGGAEIWRDGTIAALAEKIENLGIAEEKEEKSGQLTTIDESTELDQTGTQHSDELAIKGARKLASENEESKHTKESITQAALESTNNGIMSKITGVTSVIEETDETVTEAHTPVTQVDPTLGISGLSDESGGTSAELAETQLQAQLQAQLQPRLATLVTQSAIIIPTVIHPTAHTQAQANPTAQTFPTTVDPTKLPCVITQAPAAATQAYPTNNNKNKIKHRRNISQESDKCKIRNENVKIIDAETSKFKINWKYRRKITKTTSTNSNENLIENNGKSIKNNQIDNKFSNMDLNITFTIKNDNINNNNNSNNNKNEIELSSNGRPNSHNSNITIDTELVSSRDEHICHLTSQTNNSDSANIYNLLATDNIHSNNV